jgi:hypothetical protein
MAARHAAPRKNGNPEHRLQVSIREYLTVALPTTIEWTANGAGQKMTMFAATKAKSAGVRRGWPDLMFLFPDGVTRYIELKTDVGSLSPEQRAFRDRCAAAPADMWALCRSIEDVAVVLTRWGVRLTAHPFYPVKIGAA